MISYGYTRLCIQIYIRKKLLIILAIKNLLQIKYILHYSNSEYVFFYDRSIII